MNTVYLIRHGENTANLTKEFSYKLVDYSLTPKGRLQAAQTGETLKPLGIEEIYSSPLKRARETAEIIAETLAEPGQAPLPVTIIEEFREVNVGILEGMQDLENAWKINNEVFGAWLRGVPDLAYPGGEDLQTANERVLRALKTVLRGKDDRRIVVVAHGGIFTACLPAFCPGVTLVDFSGRDNHNCSITETRLEASGETVQGELVRWADCSHLYGEAAQLVFPYVRLPKE